MIMTIFDSLSEYWSSFANAPLGFQLVLGAGAITAFGAAKTGWKMLFPIRWATAKTLRGTAWLLHHTENAANNVSNRLSNVPQGVTASSFDTSSKEAYLRTLKHFTSKKIIKSLSDEQLNLLADLGSVDVYKTKDKLEKNLFNELRERRTQITAQHVQDRLDKKRQIAFEVDRNKTPSSCPKRDRNSYAEDIASYEKSMLQSNMSQDGNYYYSSSKTY